jgi:hypothetical protein
VTENKYRALRGGIGAAAAAFGALMNFALGIELLGGHLGSDHDFGAFVGAAALVGGSFVFGHAACSKET